MPNKLLTQYVALEQAFRELEEKRSELREKIVTSFKKEGLNRIEDPALGVFTIARKTSWVYTPAVKKIEERLKIAKYKEQEKGLAESKITEYLTYNLPKHD